MHYISYNATNMIEGQKNSKYRNYTVVMKYNYEGRVSMDGSSRIQK